MMKYKTVTTLSVFMFCLALVSCGEKQKKDDSNEAKGEGKTEAPMEVKAVDSYDLIADDIVGIMDSMVSILEKAKDVESAHKVVADLDLLAEESNKIAERLKLLGKPDEVTLKAVNDKMGEAQGSITERMVNAMGGIMNDPEAAKIIQEGMLKFSEKTAPMGEIAKEYFGEAQ